MCNKIFYTKEAVCSSISTFVSSFFVCYTCRKVCQIYLKYINLYEHYTDKNNNK